MPDYSAPPEYEIASLKKRSEGRRDLMMPGNGIPWEDRGGQGSILAFLRTCMGSLTHHARMLDHIRRPETTHEAQLFAIVCSVIWTLAALIEDGVSYLYYNAHPEAYDVNGSQFLTESLIQAALVGLLVFVAFRIAVAVYNKLIAGVVRSNRVPPVLTYNVMAYSLGPSILALIPVVGWIIAAIWILINAMIAGASRLYLRTREAVINACLIGFVAVLVFLGAWLAWWLIWSKVMLADAAVTLRKPPSPTNQPLPLMRPSAPPTP